MMPEEDDPASSDHAHDGGSRHDIALSPLGTLRQPSGPPEPQNDLYRAHDRVAAWPHGSPLSSDWLERLTVVGTSARPISVAEISRPPVQIREWGPHFSATGMNPRVPMDSRTNLASSSLSKNSSRPYSADEGLSFDRPLLHVIPLRPLEPAFPTESLWPRRR